MGIDGVRDAGAIESVLAAAQNPWFYRNGDHHEIGAAYAFHLAQSPAFPDGNKRTAIASAIAVLVANECEDCGAEDEKGLAAVLRRQFPRP